VKTRTEVDSLGAIEVPVDKYWGAQTQRSLLHFNIGTELIPVEVIHAYGLLKEAAALANEEVGILDSAKANLIVAAAKEVSTGQLDDHFPLRCWQTGSGTQTNMNLNEVIANRAIELSSGVLGSKEIHPNDDVNKCQSSNDTFPTASCIAASFALHKCADEVHLFDRACSKKGVDFRHIIKVGRTHLQDAVPIALKEQFFAYSDQLTNWTLRLKNNSELLRRLPIGGTAVGTGLNA